MSAPRLLRFTGPLSQLAAGDRRSLVERTAETSEEVRLTTEAIIDLVRRDRDKALISLARELDKARLTDLEVPRNRTRAALDALDPALRRAMERTAANLVTVHRAQLPQATESHTETGVLIGRRPDPLQRVGVYAPGGRAAYPSSVLMGVIPARVAGVPDVIVCSPPEPSGSPPDAVLAAAELAGADRVFAIGGAGAIAAMAYGTESVPRVDRIVGPGNAYVAEAKLLVSRVVAIDLPAGPTELLIIADGSSDAAAVAREALAQGEHDPDAIVVIVAIGQQLAGRVRAEIEQRISEEPRKDIIKQSMSTRGALLVADSLDEAVAFSNDFGPEHLLLAVEDPRQALDRVRNAGTVFLGSTSSVAFGDYMTGANHVLPTGGLARSYSGLSTLDFVRWTSYQEVDGAAAARLAEDVAIFAGAERLPAHAAAVRAWSANP